MQSRTPYPKDLRLWLNISLVRAAATFHILATLAKATDPFIHVSGKVRTSTLITLDESGSPNST